MAKIKPLDPVPVVPPAAQAIAGFKVEMWPLEWVKRYPNNPRHNEAAIGKVAASIRDFGWRQPIVVDEQGVIIAGDTRFLAAQLLHHTEVPVHQAIGLSPERVKAYRLADNRVGAEAEFDTERLLTELQALQASNVALETTGFEETELDELLGTGRGLVPGADPEAIPPVPAEPKSKLGEIYKLGAHVLTCGDCRSSGVWLRLFRVAGVDTADLLWTDPPYDVDYQGGTAQKMKIQNDALGHEGTVKLLRASLSLALIHLKPGAGMYVCAPHGPQFYAFAKVGTELDWWRQTILWVKDSFAFGRSDFHYRHEAIVAGEAPQPDRPFLDEPKDSESVGYGWKPLEKGRHAWYGGRRLDTVWEVDRPRVNDDHPTAKPVELVERAVLASSKRGAVILDPFAGGGSALICAETQGRRALCIELDPRFVDVIIARWEELTGLKATLVSEIP